MCIRDSHYSGSCREQKPAALAIITSANRGSKLY